MKSLFDNASRDEIIRRVSLLRADSLPKWGKMNVAQMLAHCIDAQKITFGEKGDVKMPVGFLTTALGHWLLIKMPMPVPKNMPSHPLYFEYLPAKFEQDRDLLIDYVRRFAKGRSQTWGIHPAFGRITPEECAALQYKHLDHHLRQFGV
jgi:hypothetical protein